MKLLLSLKLHPVAWDGLDRGAQTGKVGSDLIDTQWPKSRTMHLPDSSATFLDPAAHVWLFFPGFCECVVSKKKKGIGPGEVGGQRLGTLHFNLLRLRREMLGISEICSPVPLHEGIFVTVFQMRSSRLSRDRQARQRPLAGIGNGCGD